MGQDTRSIFQYLKDEGYEFLIGGFHVKGQVIDAKGVAAWGYGGQTVERGDWIERQAVAQARRSGERLEEAGRAVPSTSCRAPRGTIRWRICRTAPSTGSITSWRRANCCRSTSPNTHLVVEHEYPKARIQDRERLTPILQGSIAFVRAIDRAAACMYALQHDVLAAQGIPIQGVGRQPLSQLITPWERRRSDRSRRSGIALHSAEFCANLPGSGAFLEKRPARRPSSIKTRKLIGAVQECALI